MGLSDLFISVDASVNCSGVVTQFIPDGGYGIFQLVFLMCAYGFVLFKASGLIADGSEMLMLVLNPGLIGGLVLPVMGAVPDGAMVLFSGLGDDAQEQLKVGVGTLAGSTIMLITVPWAVCTFMGRVDIDQDARRAAYRSKEKLTRPATQMARVGTLPDGTIRRAALLMGATALVYLVIQGPSFRYSRSSGSADTASIANSERGFALAGLILSFLCFVGYSAYQVLSASALEQQKHKIAEARKKAFRENLVSISFFSTIDASASSSSAVVGSPELRQLLRSVFSKIDTDRSGTIEEPELAQLFSELRVKISKSELRDLIRDIDHDSDGRITFEEFVAAVERWMVAGAPHPTSITPSSSSASVSPSIKRSVAATVDAESARAPLVASESKQQHGSDDEDEGEEEEEEEDEEDEAAGLSPMQIKLKAGFLLITGVLLVTIFSDPMVDVLSQLGQRLGIPAFYVSFVVTPLASNASELIASIIFAIRKTRGSISMTYSALLGAATMNNTFCLSIFLALVYFKKLAWEFSAEVTAILFCELCLLLINLTPFQDMRKATFAMLLYPLSIFIVWFLENVVGWN